MSQVKSPHVVQLEHRKRVLEANIQEAKRELEKVVFALRTHEQDDLFGNMAERPDVAPLAITEGGTIKNLPVRIVEILTKVGHVMTITDMAEYWFDYSMPITPDQLRRRLSVTASAIFKNPKPGEAPPIVSSGYRNANRELYWAIPSWLENGKLNERYMAPGKQMITS